MLIFFGWRVGECLAVREGFRYTGLAKPSPRDFVQAEVTWGQHEDSALASCQPSLGKRTITQPIDSYLAKRDREWDLQQGAKEHRV